jgi:hypothetical protein
MDVAHTSQANEYELPTMLYFIANKALSNSFSKEATTKFN